jgi:tetratricopeptide (TPR) repeat protein
MNYMKKSLAFIVLSTLILSLAHAQSFDNGVNELQNENFVRAKQELLTVYNADKSTTTAFYLANAYNRLGAPDSAYYYYQKAESATDAYGYLAKARLAMMDKKGQDVIKPLLEKAFSVSKNKNAEVFFQAGILTYHPDKVNLLQAMEYVTEAHRMDAGKIYYGLILGDIYQDLAMSDPVKYKAFGGKAMNKYEEMQARDRKNVLTNIRLGRLWYASTNYDSAMVFLERANSIDPRFSIAHKELGEVYYIKKRYEDAAEEFRKYIELNNNDSRAKMTYSGFLYQLKEYQKAIDAINTFLISDSNNYVYHRISAFSYYELKKPAEAQESMNRFWQKVGTNKVTGLDYSYAGKIAAAKGDTANAIKYFKTSVELDTTNADLQSEYAKALFTAKRYKESIVQYKKRMTMEKAPASLDYYYLGRAYYSNGEYVLADTTFAEFVRLQPKSPDGYLWRAKSMEQLDKSTLKGTGSQHYLKFIEIASTDVTRNKSNLVSAYFYLGYVSLTAKDNEKAMEYWGKLLELDPGNAIKSEYDKLKGAPGKKK